MNMKFGFHRVFIWINIQKKLKFLSLTVSKKNAMLSCKISKIFIRTIVNFEFLQGIIAFFSKTVRPRNMNFGLHRVSIWVIEQKKFKFLYRTVSEKRAMIILSIHRIFLENCATKEHEIRFA